MTPMPDQFDAERQLIRGVPCGPMAWAIFRSLWVKQGHPVTRHHLRSLSEGTSDNILRQHIYKLRRRLRGTGYDVKTVPFVGYELRWESGGRDPG